MIRNIFNGVRINRSLVLFSMAPVIFARIRRRGAKEEKKKRSCEGLIRLHFFFFFFDILSPSVISVSLNPSLSECAQREAVTLSQTLTLICMLV